MLVKRVQFLVFKFSVLSTDLLISYLSESTSSFLYHLQTHQSSLLIITASRSSCPYLKMFELVSNFLHLSLLKWYLYVSRPLSVSPCVLLTICLIMSLCLFLHMLITLKETRGNPQSPMHITSWLYRFLKNIYTNETYSVNAAASCYENAMLMLTDTQPAVSSNIVIGHCCGIQELVEGFEGKSCRKSIYHILYLGCKDPCVSVDFPWTP